MLYESPTLRVTADDGVATLWLAFPGSPVNALDLTRVTEVGRALDAVAADPHLDALVVRSGLPGGFCGGYAPATLAIVNTDDDATAFALAGQRTFDRLAAAGVVSVAFIEGPCLGPGLELALACDYRLAVAGPDSEFGFPDAAAGVPPCWGGPTRLERLGVRGRAVLLAGGYSSALTAREARQAGLVDHAFSQRRGKIELRTWLDAVQAGPKKRRSAGRAALRDSIEEAALARERVAFRQAIRDCRVDARPVPSPIVADAPPLPEAVVAFAVDHVLTEFAVEAALRGRRAVVVGSPGGLADLDRHFDRLFAEVAHRGRATPLEVEQTRKRLTLTDDPAAVTDAGLVVADPRAGFDVPAIGRQMRPAAILGVLDAPPPDHPRAVGLGLPTRWTAQVSPGPATDPSAVAALTAWLPALGFREVAEAETPAARLAPLPVAA